MRVSYSALDDYKTCPLKFKYSNIERIKVPKNKELIFGSLIHEALHFMFERNPLYPTLDEIVNFFAAMFEREKNSANNNGDLTDGLKDEGIALLKKFYNANPPWNFNVLDLESRFEVLIEDPETDDVHILVGVIDRLDKIDESTYEIIDYKTAKKMPSQETVDKNLQLSLYQLGILKRWPHLSSKNIKMSLYFLKHGEKIGTTRDEKSLWDTKKQVLDTIKEIKIREKNNDFPPAPSALCDWCGYRRLCPMFRHLYEKEKTPATEEIQAIVKEFFTIKKQNEKNTKRLQELKNKIALYLDEQKISRVFGDEGYITRHTKITPVYDYEKLKEILLPLGKWEDVLKIDETKLTEVIKSLPSSQAEETKKAILKYKETQTLIASGKKVLENAESEE